MTVNQDLADLDGDEMNKLGTRVAKTRNASRPPFAGHGQPT
jgi:hypothetical protein